MSLFQLDAPLGGSPECPCIDPKDLVLPTCDENNSTIKYSPAMPAIPCFPKDYGITCKQHDLSFFPECTNTSEISLIPPWCHLKWCFVDAGRCFPSKQEYQEFPLLSESFASFTTCGNLSKHWKHVFQWKDRWNEQLSFEAVFPDYEYPYHYILEENGTIVEYTKGKPYSGNGTLSGVMLDYLEELKLRTNIKEISLNLPSGGSRKRFNATSYTASVYDVGSGIFDLGFGAFWITSDRLDMTSFTIPLYESPVYLYELDKDPDKDELLYNIKQTFRPFSAGLCMLLFGMVFAVGCVNIFVSNRRGDHASRYRALSERDFKKHNKRRRFITFSLNFSDSFMRSFNQCFGRGISMDRSSSLGHKILMAGFAFFALTLKASYTANLTCFLTNRQFGDLISSMDVAIEKKIKICAPAALKTLLKGKYGGNIFYFVEDLPQTKQAIEYLKNGRCDAIAADHIEMTTVMENICESKLVSIKTLVAELPVSIPIQPKYASLFSEAMLKLENDGIDFLELFKPYKKALVGCQLYPTGDFSPENSQMYILNMTFPLIALFWCFIFAFCIKLIDRSRSNLNFQKLCEQANTGGDGSRDSKVVCVDEDLEINDSISVEKTENETHLEFKDHPSARRLTSISKEINEKTENETHLEFKDHPSARRLTSISKEINVQSKGHESLLSKEE